MMPFTSWTFDASPEWLSPGAVMWLTEAYRVAQMIPMARA